MDYISLLAVLLVCLSCYGVHGKSFSDLDIEEQLKFLNKPFIESFQDEAGDIYDCVDIHKQPAFDHPLLKNHKVPIKPPRFPTKAAHTTTSTNQSRTPKKRIECPQGYVPIRRTSKEDLIRARSFLQPFNTSTHPLSAERPGIHRAVYVSLLQDPHKLYPFTGVEAAMSVNNPQTAPEQQSAALMWITGPLEDKQALQAGWMTAPSAFGDGNPRLFIFWQGKGNEKGCFNLFCPGFVQYSSSHPIGQVLQSSLYGGEQKEIELSLQMERSDGNWWLMDAWETIRYGYWPGALFPLLKKGGDQIGWGGVSVATKPNLPSPAMGSGHIPDGNFNNTAYFTRMKYFKLGWVETPAKFIPRDPVVDTPKCFGLSEIVDDEKFGYGGPGGNCGA